MILAALFWSCCSLLIALIPAAPHTGQLYLKCGSTRLLYIFYTVTMGRYFLEKRNIPNPRETFFVTAEICSAQLRCLSTITPKVFYIFYHGNILLAYYERGLCHSIITYIFQSLFAANYKTMCLSNIQGQFITL